MEKFCGLSNNPIFLARLKSFGLYRRQSGAIMLQRTQIPCPLNGDVTAQLSQTNAGRPAFAEQLSHLTNGAPTSWT